MRMRVVGAAFGMLALLGVGAKGAAIPGGYCLPVKKELRSVHIEFTLPTVDGGTVSFSTDSGKPAVIGFFATWCGPCNDEMPAFVDVAHRYQAQGFEPILVDLYEKPGTVKPFMKRFNVDFPVAIDNGDVFDKLLSLHEIPSSAFYNAHGVLTCLVQVPLEPKEIDNEASAAVSGWMP